jgi:hypothetical protein
MQARTKTFITLDRFSGVCKDDPSLDTCCEVPASITGTYLADSAGDWNTEAGFSYVKQIYAVSLTGLTYTNEQWKQLMFAIKQRYVHVSDLISFHPHWIVCPFQFRLYQVAEARGALRDISWNLVAWASFTAVSAHIVSCY